MRWRKIAFACATALLVLATAVLLLLPSIAERAIVARLTALGLEDVALRVADLSFHRIRLADVRIGERFDIERADVTFELRPLRMRTARVSGVRWEIGTTTSGLDLAPFDRLRRTSAEKTKLPFDRIEIESARLSLPSAGAHVNLNASLDPEGLAGLDLQGTAGTLELGGRKLDELAMTATSTGGHSIRWNATGKSEGLSLQLAGVARIQLEPASAQIEADLAASGELALASLELDDVRAVVRLTASVDRQRVVATILQSEATAAAGTWQNTRFTAIRAVIPKQEIAMRFGETPKLSLPLRLSWKRLRAGKTELGRGMANLRIDAPRTVLLQRAEAHLEDGGTLWVGPTRFELGAQRIGFDLVVDHVAMKRWLEAIARGKVEGDGRLSGRVPVRVELKPLRIRLGRGELFAKPGAVLRVTDLKTAETWIGQAVLGSELAGVVKKRLLEALQELELNELEFRFVPQGDDVDLTVHLAGRGTRGSRQEIGGLTVNFHNFGAGLNQVLRAQEEMKHDPILDLFQ